MQTNLFSNDPTSPKKPTHFEAIPGLSYWESYISQEEEKELVSIINQQTWQTTIKRWTQHYGYQYDYKARSIDYSMRLGTLPKWSLGLANQLVEDGIFTELPDQLLINNYEPGQGIAPHTDCEPCFEDTIVSVSLGGHAIIYYSKGKEKIAVPLSPRSMVVMKGESRYFWKHGIPGRKKDVINGLVIPRVRRISMTFRKVIEVEK